MRDLADHPDHPTKASQPLPDKRRLRGQIRLWDVERRARRALVRYRRRLRRRTGVRWRLGWVTRPTRHWRASLGSPAGVRVHLYYREKRGRWEPTGMPLWLRALIRAHTGVEPTERAYELQQRAWRRRFFAEHGGRRHPILAAHAVTIPGGLDPVSARELVQHRNDGRRPRTLTRMSRTRGVVLAFGRPRRDKQLVLAGGDADAVSGQPGCTYRAAPGGGDHGGRPGPHVRREGPWWGLPPAWGRVAGGLVSATADQDRSMSRPPKWGWLAGQSGRCGRARLARVPAPSSRSPLPRRDQEQLTHPTPQRPTQLVERAQGRVLARALQAVQGRLAGPQGLRHLDLGQVSFRAKAAQRICKLAGEVHALQTCGEDYSHVHNSPADQAAEDAVAMMDWLTSLAGAALFAWLSLYWVALALALLCILVGIVGLPVAFAVRHWKRAGVLQELLSLRRPRPVILFAFGLRRCSRGPEHWPSRLAYRLWGVTTVEGKGFIEGRLRLLGQPRPTVEGIVRAYGACLERSGAFGRERDLPYPKDLIAAALVTALRSAEDGQARETLKVGLIALDWFLPEDEWGIVKPWIGVLKSRDARAMLDVDPSACGGVGPILSRALSASQRRLEALASLEADGDADQAAGPTP